MQGEGGDLAVEADHESGDGAGCQVHVARLVGADSPGAAGRYAVFPVDVDGFHATQADVQCAIDRRAGARQDADDGERLVVVLDQADGRHAVGQHQFVAEFVVQGVGHLRAEHDFERIGLEGAALGQLQGLVTAVLVVLEITLVGAHDPVAAVGVTQRDGDGPFDLRVAGVMLEAVPADVVGGVADAKHRVEQQIHRAGAGADDQVGTADGAGEAGAGFVAHTFHSQQQAHRQGNGEGGQKCGEAAIGQAGQGKTKQVHQDTSDEAGRAARLSSARDR